VNWTDVAWGAAYGGGAGLLPEFALGSLFSGYATANGLTMVTQWGGSAAATSPWVMLGANNLRNYLLSGVLLKYALQTGTTMWVDPSQLAWPSGVEMWKGLLGQRIICGGP
jgi:hypothetical protein